MKKLGIPIFFLILISFCPLAADTSIQFRADAFFPTSNHVRKIFGDDGASYGVEASTSMMGCFDGWFNFDWYQKHGRSIVGCQCKGDSTKMEIANFSFGVKIPYLICDCFAPYLGIGPSFSKVWLQNKTQCQRKNASKWACGGVVKMGIHYYFCEFLFLDFFVDYLYQPVFFHKRVEVGGFKTGGGMGVIF